MDFFNYTIDWGATGTWGILLVTIGAVVFAWRQIESNKKFKRTELAEKYIDKLNTLILNGTVTKAVDAILSQPDDGLEQKNPDYIELILFLDRLARLYEKGYVDKDYLASMRTEWLALEKPILKSMDPSRKQYENSSIGKDIGAMLNDIIRRIQRPLN